MGGGTERSTALTREFFLWISGIQKRLLQNWWQEVIQEIKKITVILSKGNHIDLQ